jgi:hypothetical protein
MKSCLAAEPGHYGSMNGIFIFRVIVCPDTISFDSVESVRSNSRRHFQKLRSHTICAIPKFGMAQPLRRRRVSNRYFLVLAGTGSGLSFGLVALAG